MSVCYLRQGDVTLFSNVIWREDVSANDPQLAVTSPLLAYGEIEVGLYMNSANPRFTQLKNLLILKIFLPFQAANGSRIGKH